MPEFLCLIHSCAQCSGKRVCCIEPRRTCRWRKRVHNRVVHVIKCAIHRSGICRHDYPLVATPKTARQWRDQIKIAEKFFFRAVLLLRDGV